ncbi:MAG: peptide deformylase [bacterium]|nr:peptide deformylase [bacterium]
MILQKENKILREKAKKVDDPKSSEIKVLIKKMAEAMFAEPDGIGIAAPQLGAGLRIFLVAKDILQERKAVGYLVFINPVMKNASSKKNKDTEGCLSVRSYYGDVLRPEKITVEYFDESGKKHHRGASGLFARVIQHELDHLEGILFTDKAKNIKRFPQNLKDA